MNPSSPDPQTHAQVLRLLEHAQEQQRQLETLLHDAQESRAQLEALVAATLTPRGDSLEDKLAETLTQVTAALEGQGELTQNLTKLTRTQFKTNSLSEAQNERLGQAITLLQELGQKRETLQLEREESRADEREHQYAAGRAALAAELLPAIDGLEAAITSGGRLLEKLETPSAPVTTEAPPPPAPKGGFFSNLFGQRTPAPTPIAAPAPAPDTTLRDTLRSWLRGLELAQERFMGLLEAEGIEAIDPQGAPFDPRQHVAIEGVSSRETPGTILNVHRKGYRQGGRVLRYAEVTVAK